MDCLLVVYLGGRGNCVPAVPATGLLESALGASAAIIVSNALFGAIHYFTLRWKLGHCVFAALGGIGLSRLLESSGDLMLVILVHFIATFLNTPRSPEAAAPQA